MKRAPLSAAIITSAVADYLARNPKRFPNPPAALNVFATAAESWEKETGADPAKLSRYFTVKANGRFDFPPLNKLVPVLL